MRRADASRIVRPMILYPAIDLKDGQCVRLLRGDMARGDRLRRRSGGAGAAFAGGRLPRGCISSISNGAFAGRAGQRRGGRGDPRRA